MVGMTCPELGGSEYFDMLGATGNNVPKVNAEKALALYKAMEKMIHADIPSSIITPSLGGLGVAAAKAAMGGRVGLVLDLAKVPQEKGMSDLEVLFSESNSRFLISCKPEKSAELEKALASFPLAKVGRTTEDRILAIKGASTDIKVKMEDMLGSYKSTLAGV